MESKVSHNSSIDKMFCWTEHLFLSQGHAFEAKYRFQCYNNLFPVQYFSQTNLSIQHIYWWIYRCMRFIHFNIQIDWSKKYCYNVHCYGFCFFEMKISQITRNSTSISHGWTICQKLFFYLTWVKLPGIDIACPWDKMSKSHINTYLCLPILIFLIQNIVDMVSVRIYGDCLQFLNWNQPNYQNLSKHVPGTKCQNHT